jgi:hypothetical protein
LEGSLSDSPKLGGVAAVEPAATMSEGVDARAQARRATPVARATAKPKVGKDMRRHRTTAAALVFAASVLLPAAAHASGPLLSGYGPPGAGTQSILGASLVNGPGGGSNGSSTGGGAAGGGSPGSAVASGGGAVSATSAQGAASRFASGQRHASGTPQHGGGANSGASASTAGGAAPGTHPRAAGANPNSAHLGAAAAVDNSEAGASWLSGSDLLALVLASGALALVALATIRLARTGHD